MEPKVLSFWGDGVPGVDGVDGAWEVDWVGTEA